MKDKIKEALKAAGVKNLKEFGYPHVNTTNILTDYIFRQMFDSMLEEHPCRMKVESEAVAELRAEIAAATEKP